VIFLEPKVVVVKKGLLIHAYGPPIGNTEFEIKRENVINVNINS